VRGSTKYGAFGAESAAALSRDRDVLGTQSGRSDWREQLGIVLVSSIQLHSLQSKLLRDDSLEVLREQGRLATDPHPAARAGRRLGGEL